MIDRTIAEEVDEGVDKGVDEGVDEWVDEGVDEWVTDKERLVLKVSWEECSSCCVYDSDCRDWPNKEENDELI